MWYIEPLLIHKKGNTYKVLSYSRQSLSVYNLLQKEVLPIRKFQGELFTRIKFGNNELFDKFKKLKIIQKYYDHYDNRTLGLHITTRCNLRCIHCFQEQHIKNPQKYKPCYLLDWKKILKEAVNDGYKSVMITGGEPLLHPDIIKIINYAYSVKLKAILYTNATLLSEQIVKLIKDKIDYVQVSLYSSIKDIHNKTTNNIYSFDQTIKGLKLLSKYKVSINISVPKTMESASEKQDTLNNLLKKEGINAEYINYDYWLLPKHGSYIRDKCSLSISQSLNAPIRHLIAKIFRERPFIRCFYRGKINGDIRWNGETNICEVLADQKQFSLGKWHENLFKTLNNNAGYLKWQKANLKTFGCDKCENNTFCNACPGEILKPKVKKEWCEYVERGKQKIIDYAENYLAQRPQPVSPSS